MKTKEKTQRLTTKQRRRLRERQVRRQKILLFGMIALLLLILAVRGIAGSASKNVQKEINSTCEAYRGQVTEVSSRYGMTKYVDLILALMMQESSGRGPDVMQSSEGAYNTLYPQVPNGIKDTAYSIQCGIQELKYAMDKAGVTSPTDMDRIELALQAYNFGANSYFSYLEEHDIDSWSRQTAEAFAQMASGGRERSVDNPFREPAGPWDYGDQRYPEHVLQYYHPE